MRIRFLRRFIWAVDAVIIALLIFVASHIFLPTRPKGEEGLLKEEAAMVEKPIASHDSRHSLQDYSVIWSSEPEEIVRSPDEGLHQATQVKEELERLVKVWGTVIEPTFSNFAILEDLSKKRQKCLKEGEFLGEAKISRIMRDRVIFEFRGQEIALSIKPDTSRGLLAIATGPIKLYGGKPPEEPPQRVPPPMNLTPPPPEPLQEGPLSEQPAPVAPEEPPQEPTPRPEYTLPTTENP